MVKFKFCWITEVFEMNKSRQGCHFTLKPGKTWKNLEFENLGKKKPGNWEILKITWDF